MERELTEKEIAETKMVEIVMRSFEEVLKGISQSEPTNKALHIMVSVISEEGIRAVVGNGCPMCHLSDLVNFSMNTANIKHIAHPTKDEIEDGSGSIH